MINSKFQTKSKGKRVSRRTSDRQLEEKVIDIRRVARKYKGGNRIGFSVLVAVGDKKGRVGVALANAPSVRDAIRKAVTKAEKNLITVPLREETIPHEVRVKRGAAKLLLKPAPTGAGVAASGTIRAVAELAGIHNLSSKSFGSNNPILVARATLDAFRCLKG